MNCDKDALRAGSLFRKNNDGHDKARITTVRSEDHPRHCFQSTIFPFYCVPRMRFFNRKKHCREKGKTSIHEPGALPLMTSTAYLATAKKQSRPCLEQGRLQSGHGNKKSLFSSVTRSGRTLFARPSLVDFDGATIQIGIVQRIDRRGSL